MKNRAKCKLCGDVLESFHTYDYVTCKCGEISITGGTEKLECSAKNWGNFLRVDDEGNEIIVKVKDSETIDVQHDESPDLSLKDKVEMLREMTKNIENLPQAAMIQPVTHYDLFSFMAIITSILDHPKNS